MARVFFKEHEVSKMSNVYVYEQGAVLKYKENRLIINYSEDDFKSIPIENIDNIVIFGAIQVSTKCVQQMLTRGVNLTFLSKNGSYFWKIVITGTRKYRKAEITI